MNHSILIVGTCAFCMMVQKQMQSFESLSVNHAEDAVQAGLALQAKQPDLMVVQADDAIAAAATLKLKDRKRFRWVYVLAITSQSPHEVAQLEKMAQLLSVGADATLALENLETESHPHEAALLQAQLKVGFETAGRYRELLQTNDLLSTIALVDPLTELSNRRALDWDLPRQVQRSRDRKRPLSLMIFDLDFFKNINDTYGHLVGDVSLKLLSARLRHNLRSNDTLFRYGGEEFVVLLTDTRSEEAGEIGQRLCRIIGSQAFTINDDLELSLTVSVGVATLKPEDDAKGLTLLERADGRLRQAKQTGRNRVVTV